MRFRNSAADGSRTRRRVLQSLAIGGALGVGGCVGDSDSDDELDDTSDDEDPSDGDPGSDDDGMDDDDPSPEPTFEVSELEPAELTLTSGATLTVEALIENTGESEGTQEVELQIDGDEIATQSLTLEAGADAQVTFEGIETGEIEPGEYQFGVATEDGGLTGTLVIEEEDLDLVTLVSQPTHNNVPEDVHSAGGTPGIGSVAETYGQTFTVEEGFDVVELHVANYDNADAVATLTLFRGDPLTDSTLEEVESERIDWPNNEEISLEWSVEEGGTYYLEMSDGETHPTWFWYELPFGENGNPEELEDVGGKALLDRAPAAEADLPASGDTNRDEEVEDANFRFWVKAIHD